MNHNIPLSYEIGNATSDFLKNMNFLNIVKKYSFLIGIALFVFVVKDLDFSYYKKLLSEINIYYFLAGIILSPVVIYIKSYRWKKICEAQNINYSMKKSFLIYGASLFLGLATPGRIGELSKIAYLKRDGYKVAPSSLNSILDRVFDILFLIIFTTAGLILTSKNFSKINIQKIILIFLAGTALAIILLILFFKKSRENSLKKFLQDFARDLKLFNSKTLAKISGITLFSWIVYFISVYFFTVSIDLHQKVSFFYLSLVSVLNSLISLLPISILGIGTRDASFIILFSPLNIPKEQIIAFSMLIFSIYIPVAITGLISWLALNKKLTKNT